MSARYDVAFFCIQHPTTPKLFWNGVDWGEVYMAKLYGNQIEASLEALACGGTVVLVP